MNGLLMRALESKEKLEMIYLSNSNEISQRQIRVIEVNKQSFNWISEKNYPTSKCEGHSPMKVGDEFSVGVSQN